MPSSFLQSAIDLSHLIAPDMPVYPGAQPPEFIPVSEVNPDGFQEKRIVFYSHTGTHMDAPAHMIQGAKTLDRLPISRFYGKGICIDLSLDAGEFIEIEDLEPFWEKIQRSDFLLLQTGWSRWWGQPRYFSGYPVLSLTATEWLTRFDLKGVGMDTISADPFDSLDFPIHKRILGQERIIIENLTNLHELPGRGFLFMCFPLRFQHADGSPVRAVALMEDEQPV